MRHSSYQNGSELYLKGRYLEVGLHGVGSFGTSYVREFIARVYRMMRFCVGGSGPPRTLRVYARHRCCSLLLQCERACRFQWGKWNDLSVDNRGGIGSRYVMVRPTVVACCPRISSGTLLDRWSRD